MAASFPLGRIFWEKHLFRKAWEESREGLFRYACYVAYTVCASKELIEEKLKETDMWKVYQDIELPLVFTLHSMEQWGICVEGKNWSFTGKN